MKSKTKIAIVCATLICAAVVLWTTGGSQRISGTLTYSQFLEKIRAGQVTGVSVVRSNSGVPQAVYRLKDGQTAQTSLPSNYTDAMAAMQERLVDVEIRYKPSGSLQYLPKAAPFCLLLAVWTFLVIRKFTKRPRRSVVG